MRKGRKPELERDYVRFFARPSTPPTERLEQPQQLKVVESRTEYLVYDEPEGKQEKDD